MSAGQIIQTTDYKQFKQVLGNRSLKKGHVFKLTKSILAHNMLEQNPILVNGAMEIIDGQHRLEVAKANKLPIYYTMVIPGSLKEVQQLNFAQAQWLMKDYLDSYVTLGFPDYIKMADYMKQTGCSVSEAGMILTGENTKESIWFHGSRGAFKQGEMKIINWERGQRFLDYYKDLEKYFKNPKMFWTREFLKSLIRVDVLVVNEEINWQRMLEKLETSQKEINREYTVRDYLRFFEEVYNWNTKSAPTRLF